jgi:hypothetical protein
MWVLPTIMWKLITPFPFNGNTLTRAVTIIESICQKGKHGKMNDWILNQKIIHVNDGFVHGNAFDVS